MKLKIMLLFLMVCVLLLIVSPAAAQNVTVNEETSWVDDLVTLSPLIVAVLSLLLVIFKMISEGSNLREVVNDPRLAEAIRELAQSVPPHIAEKFMPQLELVDDTIERYTGGNLEALVKALVDGKPVVVTKEVDFKALIERLAQYR